MYIDIGNESFRMTFDVCLVDRKSLLIALLAANNGIEKWYEYS